MRRVTGIRGRLLATAAVALTLWGGPAAAPPSAQSRAPGAVAAQGDAAWRLLDSGRLEQAAETFRAAIDRDPRHADLHLGLGLAAHLLGAPDDARASLQEALRIDPHLTEASVLLGHLAYKQGDIGEAIRTYDDALVHAPSHPLLAEKVLRWRREAELHERFEQRLSPNFTILFEGPAEQVLATQALELLEAAYWRIGAELAIHPATPITVVLYTERQFADVTRSPAWAAAAFDGTIRVSVRGALQRGDELQRVLGHEVTHALLWSVAPSGVPFWLEEGLAVIFEGRGLDEERARVAGSRWRPSLKALHESFASFSPERAETAYAQSALAARALLDRIGPIGVTTLLSDIAGGVPFERAFAARVPVSYADFESELAGLE